MRTNEHNAVLERLFAKVQDLSPADLRVLRTELVRRVSRGQWSLGSQETDLVAIGRLEYLAEQKETQEREAAMTPEQIEAEDVRRLAEIGGVGEKIAQKFITKHGAPWKHTRKPARRAPEPSPALEQSSRREAIEADEKQQRHDNY